MHSITTCIMHFSSESIFNLDLFPHPRSSTNTIRFRLLLPFHPWADRCLMCLDSRFRRHRHCQCFCPPSTSITDDDRHFILISSFTIVVTTVIIITMAVLLQDAPVDSIISQRRRRASAGIKLEIFRSKEIGRGVQDVDEGRDLRLKWGEG